MMKGSEKAANSAVSSFLMLLLAQLGIGGGTEINWADSAQQLSTDLSTLVAPVVVSAVGAVITAAVTWLTGNTAKNAADE